MYRVIRASDEIISPEDLIDQLNAMPMSKGVSKVSYSDIEDWEAVLRQFPAGTVIAHPTDSGTVIFTKIEDGKFGRWEVKHPHPPSTNRRSEFDTARYMAGSGYISRGEFQLQ